MRRGSEDPTWTPFGGFSSFPKLESGAEAELEEAS